jgi:mRNA interferase YafQ
MRTIEWTSQFKRDYKREKRGRHARTLDTILRTIVRALSEDRSLGAKYRDHNLGGQWGGYRDCHLKPDLLLIYEKKEGVLRLIRLGSHVEIGF